MGALALIIFFMFLVPMLLWGAIDPRGMWEATSAWQFRDPEANEPSDGAFAFQRLAAIVALLVMVGGAYSSSCRRRTGMRVIAQRMMPLLMCTQTFIRRVALRIVTDMPRRP